MTADYRTLAIRDRFLEVYGRAPRIFRAPGRVNLIGEHTDYNDGFVLPVAIDRDVLIAAAPRTDDQVSVHSANFDVRSSFRLRDIRYDAEQKWTNYVRGVAAHLREAGFSLGGFDAVVEGNVPVGSGLSSSAALEVATATVFERLSGLDLDPVKKALICQRAENQFVGVNCGIMDQFISALGRQGHALLVDCRSLDYQLVPVGGEDVKVVVMDTMVRRGLAGSEYNVRRSQCEVATGELATLTGRPIRALRDVTSGDIERHGDKLDDVVRRRATHVVGENDRTLDGVDALRRGDVQRFGELMNQSHVSLRDLYEVSSAELDLLSETAWTVPGVYGARMTGGGFGGCAVALVDSSAVEDLERTVTERYRSVFGKEPSFYVCAVMDGAAEVALDV